MSTDYADRKVKDILTKANGQGKLAEQGIRTLIDKDHKFLLSLVTPYLDGVVAHAVERARKQTQLKEPPVAKPAAKPKEKLPIKTIKPDASISIDKLMKNWAEKFDSNTDGKVSQNHMNAMNALVKKNYSRKDK